MCTVPNNLKGLLRFCMEAGSEFSSEMEPMDPQRAKWLREALESMTVDLASEMRKRIVTIIQNISSSDFDGVMEDTASALDDLIDFTEDMNLADIFLKIGGLELLKALFNLPTNVFSAQTGMLLSNIVQNHEEAQKVAINEGFLEISMQLLLKERDPTNMSGLLSGISSLVRSCAFSQKHFIQKKGFESLFVVLETTCQPNEQNKYERFNEKTSFFIFCLCQELFDEQLEALENFGLADRIANLILTLNLPFEFLIKALILLLNGRVSSLINPPPNPAPAQSSLVKLSISDGSRKQLVSWLDSVKAQKDSLIDTETLDELAKALH